MVVAGVLYYLAQQIPVPYLELLPDNGGEFLNAHLLRFLDEYYPELDRSPSKPGTPNDNRYSEQKNSALAHAFLGDVRLDTVRYGNAFRRSA